MNNRGLRALAIACSLVISGPLVADMGASDPAATPAPLVDAYDSLADTILGAKKTEWNLVHSILAGTYRHAEMLAMKAQATMKSGKSATADVELLAALVAQLGNEGDASVAAVRKRLLEGGHHHNAKGEEQGIYDEGFVIVTRKAKKALLDAASAIGKLASSTDAAALQAEWAKVEREFGSLHEGAGK
jgi:hypothetical protein